MAVGKEINNSLKLPTSTAHQARLQVFQATRTPQQSVRIIETSWGTAKITGKLGQVHADLIEAIFYNAEKTIKNEDGRVEIIVDPYKVRMSVGGGKKYSYSTLDLRAKEIMDAFLELKIKSKDQEIIARIIDKIVKSKETRNNPLTGQDRRLWSITISNEFMELIRDDLQLYYNPMPIAMISTGIGQAVARFVLTHNIDKQPNGGWTIDKIINAVGCVGRINDRRADLKKDTENLARIGIILDVKKKKITRIKI